jgi:hypothetical protein
MNLYPVERELNDPTLCDSSHARRFLTGSHRERPWCPSNERGHHMYIGGGILTILLIILLIYLIA